MIQTEDTLARPPTRPASTRRRHASTATPTRSPVSDESPIPGGPGRTRSRTSGPNSSSSSGSTPGSRPRPSSSTCNGASRDGSPTSSSVACNGGSSSGGPSKGRPRRCSSPRSTSRGGSPRATSPTWHQLGVTIAGEPFDHLVYHFVLTYSNWEAGTVCFSESFESLSEGLQNALWELGGVPRRHRTDRLTAAVNSDPRARDVHPAIPGAAARTTASKARRSSRDRPTRTATSSRATTASSRPSTRP